MLNNSEHRSSRTMPAESTRAPAAVTARKVDFSDDALANQIASTSFHNFANELVTGPAGEPIVAALQFKVGIANAGGKNADQCVSLTPPRHRNLAHLNPSFVQMNRQHGPSIPRSGCAVKPAVTSVTSCLWRRAPARYLPHGQ